jgi:hypothetical protein
MVGDGCEVDITFAGTDVVGTDGAVPLDRLP